MILNKIKRTAICVSLLAAVSCTDNFEDINANPGGYTDTELEQDINHVKTLFTPMFNNVFILNPEWQYQLQQGLQGDIWSGYMATGTGFASGSNNTTYNLIDGWNGFAWGAGYSSIMANALKIEKRAKTQFPEFYYVSLILKVEAMHRVTDTYGPIVYSKFGTTDAIIGYDSQEEVYNQMFNELDLAVADLKARVKANEKSRFIGTDITSYGGDYKQWIKFANSLRLRMAMHIVKVNPTLAKTQAEKAVSHEFGVMTTKEDVCKITSPIFKNPINTISGAWKDIRMSADMESIMGGYNDPRITKYFNTSVEFPGQYKGIRTGIEIAAKADHEDFSAIGKIVDTKELVFMTTAEVYFLRAEGALRGWNMGGAAKDLYEAGITNSFEQHGFGASSVAYVGDNTSMAKDYVDPKSAVNNGIAVNKVTIAWDAAATNEVKLQKIITQKWIANFPEGQEAWTEYRRTGYPKLFPVLKNTSGGKITTEFGVRRVNFPQSEKDGNPGGLATGIAKLGGPDNGGTRLWWDTTGPNF
ncbi:RagB/SusD family nutrient uptake outer membrane protein [Flavobacterium sp. ZB4P13]|uniref:RagB/SusD family nutrient uptake outer membrane protein n=1 Tax=Flavobacterium sp. ZB4P13 TaxID=3401728 RepID=UPI003AAC5A9C